MSAKVALFNKRLSQRPQPWLDRVQLLLFGFLHLRGLRAPGLIARSWFSIAGDCFCHVPGTIDSTAAPPFLEQRRRFLSARWGNHLSNCPYDPSPSPLATATLVLLPLLAHAPCCGRRAGELGFRPITKLAEKRYGPGQCALSPE